MLFNNYHLIFTGQSQLFQISSQLHVVDFPLRNHNISTYCYSSFNQVTTRAVQTLRYFHFRACDRGRLPIDRN